MTARRGRDRARRRVWIALVVVAFVVATVAHTWPLATAPARLSRNDNADAELNAWILAWIAHQLPRAPAELFDANIFHPEPRTLAFSEPLLAPGLLAAPLLWAGASPVHAHNLTLLAGMVLTGLAGFGLARRLTGDRLASFLAGSLLAFNVHTLTRIPQIQAHWALWLPLAMLALERCLTDEGRGWWPATGLGLTMAAAIATSGYLATMTAIALGVAVLLRWEAWWPSARGTGPGPGALAGRLALGASMAAVLALPVVVPYWQASQEQGLVRSLPEIRSFAISPLAYLVSGSRVHRALWSPALAELTPGALFPGVVALLLAGVAVWRAPPWRHPRVRMLVGIGAVGFLLSLGPQTSIYVGLYRVFWPLQGLRDPSKFGYLVLLSVALLAAMGLAGLRDRLAAGRSRWGGGSRLGRESRTGSEAAVPRSPDPRPDEGKAPDGGPRSPRSRLAIGVALLLILLVHVEAMHAPMGYEPFKGFSHVYRALAEEPDPGAVVELPFPPPRAVYRNASFVLASTVHWKPLVNGYSGFTPASYGRAARRLGRFPRQAALREMERRGVTHAVVHLEHLPPADARRILARLEGLERRLGWELVAADPDGPRLYRVAFDDGDGRP